jgi:hypothetical protein
MFFIGTLIVTDDVSRDGNDPYMKAEIVGPTGTSYVYAGRYQVDAKAFIQDDDTPAYVAATGKPKTFETDDGDTLVRVAPERLSTVASEDRDRWVVDAARHTHRRLAPAQAGDVTPSRSLSPPPRGSALPHRSRPNLASTCVWCGNAHRPRGRGARRIRSPALWANHPVDRIRNEF